MKLEKIIIEPLSTDPLIFFHGTDREIEEAERIEEEYEKKLAAVLFAPGVDAVQLNKGGGRYEILSRSTRPGAFYQLSYFDEIGAIMHENYSDDERDRRKITRHFTSYDEAREIEILTA